ncbi:MAG: hypothetical protein ACRDA5_09605 [Clostridium sp.]
MKKIILSLALIGALSLGQTSVYKASTDSPNEKVNYKKTQVRQNTDDSETSILVEDTITPSCKCEDEKCPKQSKNDKEKSAMENKDDSNESKKQESPRETEKNKRLIN